LNCSYNQESEYPGLEAAGVRRAEDWQRIPEKIYEIKSLLRP